MERPQRLSTFKWALFEIQAVDFSFKGCSVVSFA